MGAAQPEQFLTLSDNDLSLHIFLQPGALSQLQPDILINNRCGMRADFDTPEQMIGAYQTDRAWESCITIGDQWAWKPNDRIKSLTECLHTLVRVAGGDGNLLFNVGPMPDGPSLEAFRETVDEDCRAQPRCVSPNIYRFRGGRWVIAR